jgi:predicted MPP superfamily phosphohydrolase
VRLANEWSPDLVALTGDLVDDTRYIEWIPDTLGQLRGKHGCYFVLGNHDKRVDEVKLRETLVTSGLVDLGSRTRRIAVGGRQMLLAGNERPWFGTAPTLSPCPEIERTERPLRIALAHSPDQFAWARKNDVDLLLAGHTHGGQIQVPGVGPLWAPSHRGVKYASGTFHKNPTTMHVSRGLSGLTPLRINCPPELTLLVLRCARGEN